MYASLPAAKATPIEDVNWEEKLELSPTVRIVEKDQHMKADRRSSALWWTLISRTTNLRDGNIICTISATGEEVNRAKRVIFVIRGIISRGGSLSIWGHIWSIAFAASGDSPGTSLRRQRAPSTLAATDIVSDGRTLRWCCFPSLQ